MKNLKQLAAMAAIFGATHGASAFEKDFEPVSQAGEATGIEMVNGQLMVKSNGQISGVNTPYVFVGTNTTNFAKDGFAVKEMADANSVALVNNNVYFTRSSDATNVYHFAVSARKALNGVPGTLETFKSKAPVSGILAVNEGVIYAETEGGNNTVVVGAEAEKPALPESLRNQGITKYGYANGFFYYLKGSMLMKDNGSDDSVQLDECAHNAEQTAKQIIAFDNDKVFVLHQDGTLCRGSTQVQNYTTVSGISKVVASDGKENLLITYENSHNQKRVDVYDVENARVAKTVSPVNSACQHQAVSANGLQYYVATKKIGYRAE